jgi:hypothetical protein
MDRAVQITHLNSIMEILGTTKASLWPFVEAEGITVTGLTSGTDLVPAETSGGAEALEDDFNPMLHPGGVHSYWFNPTGDHHLAGGDHADYSHGDGSTDSAASWGAYIIPNAINANTIMSKHDSAGNAEEYRLYIGSSGFLTLELHDASASATEVGVGATALTLHRGVFVVATYDGAQAAPEVHLYLNRTDDLEAGTTTETGSYVAMENTASPLLIGAGGVTATPLTEFHGRIALPFMTGKALTSAEVTGLYNIYADLLGLP